jgi:hypothetical protein
LGLFFDNEYHFNPKYVELSFIILEIHFRTGYGWHDSRKLQLGRLCKADSCEVGQVTNASRRMMNITYLVLRAQ